MACICNKRGTGNNKNNTTESGAQKLDIIIFGASGVTGFHTVIQAVKFLDKHRWGIAGRNAMKLRAVLREAGERAEKDLNNIPIIIADANDKSELLKMAEECRIIVNCTGPHQLLGFNIIEACVAAGTHYVDMCFEAYHLETIQVKFDRDAQQEKVYIVSACGFLSFVVDMGINFVQENFNGTINSIEAFAEYRTTDKNYCGTIASSTTWESVILSFASIRDFYTICKMLDREPVLTPKLGYRIPFSKNNNDISGICFPFPFFEQQVVERTQQYFYNKQQKRPIQFKNYLLFPNTLVAIIVSLWCICLFVLSQLPVTRDVLMKYPGIYSLGIFCNQCINENCAKKIIFEVTFLAVGWSDKCNDPCSNSEQQPPDKKLMATISGVNPFLGIGCTSLLASAITVIEQTSKLPDNGGVFTPGAAFRDTTILNDLREMNRNFKYVVTK